MDKLYPPIIEGTLPAFYSEDDNYGMVIHITIPFSMNRGVSSVQVGGFALKIKTAQSSTYLYTAQVTNPLSYEMEDSSWVTITLHDYIDEEKEIIQKLRIGQFYKFQLAYIQVDEREKNKWLEKYAKGEITLEEYHAEITKLGTIGYYSTIGIAKYTTKPTIYVNDFQEGFINMHRYKYTGFYNQKDRDTTERVYQYRFDVYDSFNNIIATSGDQLHNSANDTELYESYDEFSLTQDLEFNKSYRIKYTVITNNGLILSTPRYRIMQKTTIDPDIQADLVAKTNFDDGYVDISLVGYVNEAGLEETVSGSFLLTRASEDSNFSLWEEITRFQLAGQSPSQWLWRDYTAEQGKHYQYSIQQYNDKNLYSNRMTTEIVYSDFEDAFLYDGEKQLKIKYNPKVTNFKPNVLETKVNTIGSKYPFIFRNGKVYYREFPISGLISYLMDENNLFLSKDEFKVNERTTNLISENLAQERIFKMRVLEWLTNGEPKLFRSPSEGNFIVRLINVSLTPNDTLGRMLHTFNCTACEMATYTHANLRDYNFINFKDPNDKQYLRWETIEFTKKNPDGTNVYRAGEILNRHLVYTVRFTDMIPGDMIKLTFKDDTQEDIIIGATGSYYVDTGIPIKAIVLHENSQLTGSMTYSYYSIQLNLFDKVDNILVTEVPCQQFIGEHDVLKEIEYVYDSEKKIWVKNPKVDIIEFYYLNADRRTTENLIRVISDGNEIFYQDKDQKIELDLTKADPFTLYNIGTWKKVQQYNPYRIAWEFNILGYKDFVSGKFISGKDNYQPWIQVNDSIVSVEDIQNFDMTKPGKFTELKCGNGAIMEVAYQVRTIDYLIEDDPNWGVKEPKAEYLKNVQNLKDLLSNVDENYTSIKEVALRNNIKNSYTKYILALIKAQEEEKKAEGLL